MNSSIQQTNIDLGKATGTPQLAPDVTVVIAVHNDHRHLRKSIESVLNQSLNNLELIVVDDCSTDKSHTVATEYAALDRRVKVFQTPANSGGAGAPRNIGIHAASAPWITFLDSDDRLDRHACKNMLRAGEASGANLVCAQTKRYTIETKKWSDWHSRLYRESAKLEKMDEYPDLIIDTNSVAKLYSTKFLNEKSIRFPEDIHYEDLVFTANVFCRVRHIQIIPEVVYVWNVYPTKIRRSITNQRNTISNLDYRIEALKRTETVFGKYDTDTLLRRFYLKILRQDARLYLNDIATCSDEFADLILDRLRETILAIPADIFEEIQVPEKLLFAAALRGSPTEVRMALRQANSSNTLNGTAILEDNSFQWLGDSSGRTDTPTPLERKLRKVSKHDVYDVPWHKFKFSHELTSVTWKNKHTMELAGTTSDPLGHLSELTNLQFSINLFTQTKQKINNYIPATIHGSSNSLIHWSAQLEIPENLPHFIGLRLGAQLRIEAADLAVSNAIAIATKLPKNSIQIRSRELTAKIFGEDYYLYQTTNNELGLRQRRIGRKRTTIRKYGRALLLQRDRFTRLSRSPINANHFAWKIIYATLRALPLRDDKVLVESFMGKRYSDSPRAISDALKIEHPSLRQTWSFEKNSKWLNRVEQTVTRGSLGYLHSLATSKYLIDNQTWPAYFVKRRRQIYVQTWHGIPLKLMGYDEPDFRDSPKAKRDELARRVANWDYLSCPSDYFVDSFVKSYQFDGIRLPFGTPRNDDLFSPSLSRSAARAKLGIRTDRKVVLYAPTFRAASRSSRATTPIRLDLPEWVESMGDEVQLLVRPHYLNRINIPSRFAGHVVDVSDVDNINELFHAIDLLITDYSSVMFDFAVTNKPIVLYGYDIDEYMNHERGTYFDLRDSSPGIIVHTQDELQTAVGERLVEDIDESMRLAFRNSFANGETGHATRDTIEMVWGK
jgi:CDP-glycerol glycerophosphotransferase